jgi:uncharacterized lipoprotein YbaY/heat shock protein HslJ/uncharacterized lipoprotein NlpE involved in copper resistance
MSIKKDGVIAMRFSVYSLKRKTKATLLALAAMPLLLIASSAQSQPQSLSSAKADAKQESSFVIVSGSAAYRQRIAMPPDAVLIVKLEDVSRADAPAKVLAETSETFGARQVPLRFLLKVPSSVIDERNTYAVRATIKVGNELRFTTTRSYPVLTRGASNQLDLMLDAVPAVSAAVPKNTVASKPLHVSTSVPPGASLTSPSSSPSTTAALHQELVLPATFAGVLPCADCRGIAQTLSLRADGLYRLRRTYLGKDSAPVSELGRWQLDASGKRLTLGSPANASQVTRFAVVDEGHLRLLDRQGQAISTAANLDLRRTAKVDPISETLRWRGEFAYTADTASFTDCASGMRWAVAMSGDYASVVKPYRDTATPMLVHVDGRLAVLPAMDGAAREQMIIERFDSAEAGTGCQAKAQDAKPAASLANTYWKLTELGDMKINMTETQKREVRITLANEGGRVMGFGGCNQIVGSYEQEGATLRFKQMAGTRMACPAPLMALENDVLKALAAVTAYHIEGDRLILLDGIQVLARFEAVYLR